MIIQKIQNEIKDIMKYEDDFNLQIVCEAIVNVRDELNNKKQQLKDRRSMIKLIDFHSNDGSLKKHDNQMKILNKEIKKLKNVDHYSFLINGKLYQ